VHPEALPLINRERERYAMVQVPVLPLATPLSDFTHGVYCDEFAEYQTIDMRARQFCRAFIPSNGVGTAFAREILDRLAGERNGLVFNPASLTEDYEAGVYIHNAGYSQTFAPLCKVNGQFCATREFFPRRIKSAIRQRTRWVTGIGLQSWARDGWRGSLLSKYWFWRDRKGMLTNPLSLLTNMLFIAGVADWIQAQVQHRPWFFAVNNPWVLRLCLLTSLLQCLRLSLRMLYTGRIYGAPFACGVPLRQFHANFINCFASLSALWQFFDARAHGRPLVWLKTDHAYPGRDAIIPHSRGLADVLVGGAYLTTDTLSRVHAELHSDTFLVEFLLARGILSDDDLCAAVSLQSGVPFTRVDTSRIDGRIPRTLPIHIEQRFGVVPFGIDGGRLFVAGTRVPPPKMYEEVKRLTRLPVEFHLITRRNYEQLRALL
jgi:adsorption protein B